MKIELTEIKDYQFLKCIETREEILKYGFCVSSITKFNFKHRRSIILSYLENMLDRDNHLSLYINDINIRKELHEFIRNEFKPVLDELFLNYKIATSTTVVKKKGGTRFQAHQDPTICDERCFSSINLWIPLEDVDKSNGCLYFIPKSHIRYNKIRGVEIGMPKLKFFDSLRKKRIDLIQGECILFDPRTFHGSFSNKSSNNRLSILFSIVGEDVPILTPFFIENNEIAFRVQPDDFFDICTDFSNCSVQGYEHEIIF